MIKLGENYRDAEASNGGTDFKRLPPGGYVCTITKVTNYSQNEKPYLHIVYDIREGEYVINGLKIDATNSRGLISPKVKNA